ncbi:SRPBCC family protein [Methylocystis sp. IM3]|jgi:hypothetical protein|uniref:SRPBCC family protein n=1 Tax=unclassified Methylocystis TaxID=2625913 RepID=UPI0030FA9327
MPFPSNGEENVARCSLHFRESWNFPGACPDEVWLALAHGEDWPLWWKGVFLESKKLAGGDQPALGDRGFGRVRGFLPYEFKFIAEATALERPRLIEAKITGDFEGEWRAVIAMTASGTHVDFDWKAAVNLPFPLFFAALLRPLMRLNHAWTMPRGERGLRKYLARQRLHNSATV